MLPTLPLSFRTAALWLPMALLGPAALADEPAQVPLISRIAESVIPNVMVTHDDSGSMLADYVPEGSMTLNGWTGPLVNGWVAAFPGDWRKMCSGGGSNCIAVPRGWTWPVGNYSAGTVVSIKGGETNFQRRYRSPDVNKIFYNPDIRYQPWWKPDGSARMNPATPAGARLDPTVNTSTFNLTIKHTGKTRWYTAAGTTADETKDFYPGLVYRLTPGANPNVAANFTRYDINVDGEHAPATKHVNRTDCAGSRCTLAEERQNFANWFTYYRMRELLTKAAVSEALVTFKDKLRVGWGRINKTDGGVYTVIETEAKGGPVRLMDSARMQTVLTGIQGYLSWPATPLRVAVNAVGAYFTRDGSNQSGSPWLEDPTNVNSAKLACRRSLNLLMTDGYYNDDGRDGRPDFAGDVNVGDVDGQDGDEQTNADGYTYSPTKYVAERPFLDGPPTRSNTLADAAMEFFVKDLEPTIDNKVKPSAGDIAFWQHLTQFMVGFGVKGTLDSSTPEKKLETLQKIKDGDLSWPNPDDGNPQKIDDMWHAAVNTGGDFYSVSDVTELTEALLAGLERAGGAVTTEAGVAALAPFTTADNVKYVPKYMSVAWYGDVEAYDLTLTGEQEGLKWKASDKVPAAADRKLYTWDSTTSTALPFTWSGMGSVNQGLVGSEALTNFIRGDHSQEGDTKLFRDRSGKVLSDFVNSPPVLVFKYLDMGYEAFDSSYTSYVASKRTDRSEPLIVAGGNGGVVHFFRGSDGTEVFGYLPKAGLPNLNLIARKDYGTTDNFHRFFVDGPMTEADAKIGGAWTNMVLGAMGAGGKAFFALRVPTAYGSLDSSDFGASTVMWEKSGDDDADIGYMFADFAVGKLKGGGWKAFIGNGVYSTNGDAVLLVVDLADGTIERIKVDDGGDTGLMGVSLIRDVETNEVVGAYAGDMKGNAWRFDFEGAGAASWKIGFSGQPLFVATNAGGARQPITVPPVFVNHSEKGRVVLFGTGRLIEEEDSEDSAEQSYYGVWDPTVIGASSAGDASPFGTVSPDRSALAEQTIDTSPITDDNGTYYKINSSPVNWETQLGWYIDLPWSRQRVVYPSIVLAGGFVYFSTLVPAVAARQCENTSGDGYNFLLRGVDGAALTEPIFDTDGDGDIDGDDQVVHGRKTDADGRDAIIVEDGGVSGGGEGLCVDGWRYYIGIDSSGKPQRMREPCEVSHSGPKDRVWKQIVNPPTGG